MKIPDYEKIRNLTDLQSAVRFFKKAIAEGHIEQYWPREARFASRERAEELGGDGTFPDYIEMYFKGLNTGKKYRFAVETYHGSGGEWSVVED